MQALSRNNLPLQQVSLAEINKMFGSLENMYLAVHQLGFYLPELKSSCITVFFLLGVVKGEVFSVKTEKIAPGGAKCIFKKTKLQIYEELYELVQKQIIKDLGFDLSRLPNKQYMLDLIWVINPKNDLFLIKEESELNDHKIDFPIE